MTRTQIAEFVLHPTPDNQHRFVLRAANHETVLTSETYTTKANAKNGIEAVRAAAKDRENFQRRLSRSEEAYFVLRANNHEVLGTSEMYSSPSARDEGIEACRRAAQEAVVRDA